jgi:hypothetical protein
LFWLAAPQRPPQAKRHAESSFRRSKDEALIGKLVRVRACIGIPLSTVVDEEEFVLLFPCDAPRDESLAEVQVFAQGASEQVFQPMTGTRVDIENDIEAVFTGRVSRRRLDDEDLNEYPFVTIHSISKPRERVR